MATKNIGIAILAIGLIITIFTGFNYMKREKIVDLGAIEVTTKSNEVFTWSPLVGVVVMILGGAVFLIGIKKE
jgi:uncharacterized membrane protein YidH (DUF202 family)